MKLAYVRRRSSEGAGGDSVFDQRTISSLGQLTSVTEYNVPPTSRLETIGSTALTGWAPAYSQLSLSRCSHLSKQISAAGHDVCIISHEALAPLVRFLRIPKVLILHNVHSAIAGLNSPSTFMKAWLRRAERTILELADVITVLSLRECRYISTLSQQSKTIFLAPPGFAPQTLALPLPQAWASEIIVEGTLGWWRKAESLNAAVHELGALQGFKIYCSTAHVQQLSQSLTVHSLDSIGSLPPAFRFAISFDRFVAGFKLKVLNYIARYCVVFSFVDLSEEFNWHPDWPYFIRHVNSLEEVQIIINTLLGTSSSAHAARFAAFRQACLQRLTWEKTASSVYLAAEVARKRVTT